MLKYDWKIKIFAYECPYLDPSGDTKGVCGNVLNKTRKCQRKACPTIKEPMDTRCQICFYKHIKNHKEPCRWCISNPLLSSKFQRF